MKLLMGNSNGRFVLFLNIKQLMYFYNNKYNKKIKKYKKNKYLYVYASKK